MNALSAPGYCTFTATTRPSCQTALCTWPIDAAAAGTSSNSAKRVRQSSPSSSRRIAWIDSAGSGGAASWSLVSAARYGPATSSGIAASKMLMAWPIFMAPPLSSPRTLNICSAVRAWSSACTISAGLPPMRLPSPHAVRPACAAGSAAIFTLRVSAFLGISGTGPLSPDWAARCAVASGARPEASAEGMRRSGHALRDPVGQSEVERVAGPAVAVRGRIGPPAHAAAAAWVAASCTSRGSSGGHGIACTACAHCTESSGHAASASLRCR